MVWFLVVLVGVNSTVFTQDTSTVSAKKVKILPVPAFGYSPETRTYLGAVSLFTIDCYHDSLTRTSNAKTELNYTWNKQFIAEGEWNYFFRDENWFTKGLLHFSNYPDLFYGIGANTQATDVIPFVSQRINTTAEFLKKWKSTLYFGLGARFINYAIKDEWSNHIPSNQTVGVKLIGVHDARNRLLTPSKGFYLSLVSTHNWSENYYSQLEFDARKYYSVGRRPNSFSLRFYQFSVLGNAPFYDLATIGGDRMLRGYRFGRFRDHHLSNVQFEYRTPLIWRLGLATFGGCAIIYENFETISSTNFKPNWGVGLRFLVDKKEQTNLRFDYAIGRDGQNGFYVSFGESF